MNQNEALKLLLQHGPMVKGVRASPIYFSHSASGAIIGYIDARDPARQDYMATWEKNCAVTQAVLSNTLVPKASVLPNRNCSYNLHKRAWFISVRDHPLTKAGKFHVMLLDPYFDVAMKELLMSVVAPVFSSNSSQPKRFFGTVEVGVSTSAMQANMLQLCRKLFPASRYPLPVLSIAQ